MSDLADRAASEFLAAAYPDERQRARASRWLGLLAVEAAGSGEVRWWEIPALAPALPVLTVRRLILGAATASVVVWGFFAGAGKAAGVVWYFILLVAFVVLARKPVIRHLRRRPRVLRPRPPRAAARPGATPAGTYRSERAFCLRTGLTAAPAGAALGALAAWGTGQGFTVIAAQAAVAAAWGALLPGPYPLVKLSELVMSAAWEERVRFLPLLEDAAGRGVLRRAGAGYQFRDEDLHACLAASGRVALARLADRQAARLAGRGVRPAVARWLTSGRVSRIGLDVGVAAGGVLAAVLAAVITGPTGWITYPVSLLLAALAGGTAYLAVYWLLTCVQRAAVTSLTYFPLGSRRSRLLALTASLAAVALLVALAGTALAQVAAFLLPAALVAACGGWASVLARRRTRTRRRRWQRAAPDAIAAAAIAATLCCLVRHGLLTATPAAGLLFPADVWGSFLLWQKMNSATRLTVRAAADLVFALLLGGELVLFLVWLANVLGLPRREVAALRAVLDRAGALADLPWWAWTTTWLLLAAVSLAFIRWPGRLAKAARRFERWQVVTVAEVTERALTGVHVGLLALVFVGLAAPPALTPVLSGQLRAAYTTAFQRELLDEGELAAYTAIAQQLTAQPRSPVLIRLVTKIHDISPPRNPANASDTEDDNARRLGEAQAAALVLAAAPSLDQTERPAAAAAGFDQPAAEASDLAGPAAAVQHEQTKEDDAAKRVEAAADLAAKVVASLIAVPRLSDNEVVQVVREYLAGLIEDSPLKNTFAAWIERLPGAQPPPEAAAEVVPVPEQLEQAATAQLSAEFTAAGDADPVTDPFAADPALTGAQAEDPLDGAVDIVNQARYASDSSGPCSGCTVPGGSDDRPGEEPPEEHFDP